MPNVTCPPQGEERYRFVVKEHHATRLHYDFRLEDKGILKSWALPKGPSLIPGLRRLAIMVPDHSLYGLNFEGTIRKGYGAGEVRIWDIGTYKILGEIDSAQALWQGKLPIYLDGKKLKGAFLLERSRTNTNNWFLIKLPDDYSDDDWHLEPILDPDGVKRCRPPQLPFWQD